MGLEQDLKNLQNDTTRGIDINSPNSLDHLGHPTFEYVVLGMVAVATAVGGYIGYRCGHPWIGAGIGAGISALIANGVMEERYGHERGLRAEQVRRAKDSSSC